MANPNLTNVTTWMDFWTDPAIVAILSCIILLIPFIMLVFVSSTVSTFIVSMYPLYVGGVVALVTGHAATDFLKIRSVSQETNTTP